ncbi:ferredoxin reductase-like protein, partial [Dentipellis sp. KUC8613]
MPVGIFHPPRSAFLRIPRAGLRRPFHVRNLSDTANSRGTSSSRAPTVFAFTVLGGLTAAYFFWPSTSRSAPTLQDRQIAPSHFTPTTVTASEACGPNLKLITLNIPPESLPSSVLSPIWSIFVKDDDIQVERPYTPLEGIDANGDVRFWVKQYPRGEVGRWLHSKSVGDTVEIRGPIQTFPLQEGRWDEVVMISGGTGFSPFYQLLFTQLLQSETSNNSTHYTLIHSSPSVAELPPTSLLQPLLDMAEQQPDRFKLHLFVDKLNDISSQNPSLAPRVGRINKSALEDAMQLREKTSWWQWLSRLRSYNRAEVIPTKKSILVLVCGPEPMVSALAGPYGRNLSQGAVGGALGELGFKSGQVWKL